MPYNRFNNQPSKDTGWGLIFRLNGILGKIEDDIERGNLDSWNLHMDRIYVNILHKNPEEILRDDAGKIIGVKFSKEDMEVFDKINQTIRTLRKNVAYAKTHSEKIQNKNLLYDYLNKKDIWIRKKMFKMNLYLKDTERDPRKAIYGGSG